MIAPDPYAGGQVQLDVHLSAMQHLASRAGENDLDTRFTRLMTAVLGDACEHHFGEKETAGTIKNLRGNTQ